MKIETFDPTDIGQVAFDGYGPARLPDPRDDLVRSYVNGVTSEGPPAIDAAQHAMSRAGKSVLRAYGERMASLAVRLRDPDLLESALVALVLGGLDSYTPEALMVVPLVERSAELIGSRPTTIFEAAAKKVGHPGSVSIMRWLDRPDEDRTIQSMGFVEESDADGFRYRLNW